MKEVKIGQKYYHYKNPEQQYEVIAIAIQESTEKPCIVYKALYGEKTVWVRDYDDWAKIHNIDGKKVKKFNLVK